MDLKEYNDNELVILYRENSNNIYIEELISRYEAYINKVLTTLHTAHCSKYSKEDIKQEILIAFIDIVKKKFNPDSGVKFFTYMYKSLKFNSMKFIRDDRYYPNERTQRLKRNNVFYFLDIYIPNLEKELSEIEKIDRILSNNNANDDSHDVNLGLLLSSMDELLNEEQKYIVVEHFVNDRTQVDISKELGLSQAIVSRSITSSLQILKNYWE